MLRCRSGRTAGLDATPRVLPKRLERHTKRFAPARPITFRFNKRTGREKPPRASGAPGERLFGEQRGFQRGAVAAESSNDLHAERQAGGIGEARQVDARVPISVHSQLKFATPVAPMPCGAAPGADGVRITS